MWCRVFVGAIFSLLTAQLWAQGPPLAGSALSPGASEPTSLQLGQPIERELHGKETHFYKIRVEAGQFVHVVALQKGIDFAVILRDPSGREIAKTDSLNGSYGPEPVSAIVAVSGDFRLEIVASDAPAGRYEVQVTDLRAPTESDRRRMEAERVYMEGMGLWSRGDPQSLKDAAEKWRESFTLWRSLGDKYGQALSLYSSCSGFDTAREGNKALDCYNQALASWHGIADRAGEATTLSNIGGVYSALGERQKALDAYAQALPLLHAVGDRALEAITLTNAGLIYSVLREDQKALDAYAQALSLYHAIGDRGHEATTLSFVGMTYAILGEKQKALDCFAQALPIYHTLGDRHGEAEVLSKMGLLYDLLGEKQKALDSYTQALPLFQAESDRKGEAKALEEIAELYSGLKKKEKALEYYSQALLLRRAEGDRGGEAKTLSRMGGIYSSISEKRKALDYYLQALPLFRAVGDPAGEATILNKIGAVYSSLGEKQKALEYFAQARAAGDQDGEATALNNIGTVYSDLGEKRKALDYYMQALPLLRAVGDRGLEATTLNNIGGVYDYLGEKPKALEYYTQALPLHRAERDRAGEATVFNNIGAIYSDFGEKQKALEYYTQALSLFRAEDDRTGEATTLNNIGHVYDDLGEKQKALDYYTRALPLHHAEGDRSGEATTLNNIGGVYSTLGEKQKALAYYMQVLGLLRGVDDHPNEAKALTNIGGIYDAMGEKQKALEYFAQALPMLHAMGDRTSEAATRGRIGLVYYDLGEKHKALEYYTEALSLCRAVRDRAGEATTLIYLGALYNNLGENHKALEYYNQALPLKRAVGDRRGEAATLALLMAYWNKEGNGPLAAFFGKQAINAIQYIRQNIQGMEKSTQSAFLKSNEDVYRYLADVLVAQGRLFEAQQVLGMLKEEEFKEFTRDLGSGGAAGTLAMTSAERAVGERYDQAAGAVAAAWAEWNVLNEKKARTPEEDARLQQLSKQLEEAEASFQAFVSQELYQQLGKNKSADSDVRELEQKTSDLQAVLREVEPGTVALYTVAAPERLIVIMVLPDVRIAREYAIKPEALRDKVFKFWRALSTNSPEALPAAQELYKIVLGPVEKDLEAAHAKTLMWSLDDVLRYIPIAALHDGHQYVVEKYRNEVFTLSSISKLKDEPRVKSWQILAMGVSKSYGGSQPLPSVPGELHSIVHAKAGAPGGLLEGVELLDDDFTEEAFTRALAQRYPLVHIASHFLFQAGVDDMSYLLLGGKTDAGERLTLAHIKTAPNIRFLNTELLTLSACQTAMSGERNGREIDGLGEVAQRKGAKAVVASLWSVSDRSTGALMRKFYETWTANPGMPKAEALRQAQVALLHGDVKPEAVPAGAAVGTAAVPDSFAHPYYWAPFILIGNWR